MVEENTGDNTEAGSLPAGQEGVEAGAAAGTEAGAETEEQIAAAASTAEGDKGAAEGVEGVDFVTKDGKKFYSGFDKHPDWREMKDGQGELQGILEKNGFKDGAELTAALESGQSLQEILGDQDAATVIEASNNWNKAEDFWAEQEAAKLKEGETEPETVTRLETEIATLKEQRKMETARNAEVKSTKDALQVFDSEVASTVDGEKLSESEAKLAKLFLGMDNPMDDVDIKSKTAVRQAVGSNLKAFKTLLTSVKQAAVDGYVSGKSEIIPVSTEVGAAPIDTGKRFTVGKDESTEQALARANTMLVDYLNGAKAA